MRHKRETPWILQFSRPLGQPAGVGRAMLPVGQREALVAEVRQPEIAFDTRITEVRMETTDDD